MTDYAVICIDSDTGKILCHKVSAKSPMNSFWKTAKKLPHEAEFVVSIPWDMYKWMQDHKVIDYPGESTVSSTTIMDQPEVFNLKGVL